MATNKTLSPTNVTIAIPAMSDKPDASVFSNCIDKTADAVNTLNSNKANINVYNLDSNATVYINHTSGVFVFSDRGGMWTEGSASRSLTEIAASSSITVTRVSKNKLQVTSSSGYATAIYAISDGTISFSND